MFESLPELLIHNANAQSRKLALTFVRNDGTEEQLSYSDVLRSSMRVASILRDRDIGDGDVVNIALPSSVELVLSFLGVLNRGAIASILPYQIPGPSLATRAGQVTDFIERTNAAALITEISLANALHESDDDSQFNILVLDAIPSPEEDALSTPAENPGWISGDQIAYIQFTSGTSGMEKGVMLSHRAILSFVSSFREALNISPEDVFGNWLPLYHDAGLFEGIVAPLMLGNSAVFMTPFKWVRNPISYLRILQKYGVTVTSMPNFAYNHTSDRVRDGDLEGLDLSCLRHMINAAEPVLDSSHDLFLSRFSPFGLRETALGSGYGMAENTLAITLTRPGRRARADWISVAAMQEQGQAVPVLPKTRGSISFVSCGVPTPFTEVAILDEQGRCLEERRIGEVGLRSTSLFSGYLNNPGRLAAAMNNGWFSTGDMGYLAEGELYICGRKKDLIIVGGRNIHPEDIEQVANTIPGVIADHAVAFGILDRGLGTDRAILICEVRRSVPENDYEEMERQIRQRVFTDLDLTLDDLRLVKKGWIVRTGNGKISRPRNRDRYLKTFVAHPLDTGEASFYSSD